jgi:hypothetical protein
MTLHQFAALEALRVGRSGRGFSLLRVAPIGWAALDAEVEVLAAVVSAHLRRSDFVDRVREREVGVVLIETVQAEAVAARLRAVLAERVPKLEVRIGWSAVGPDQQRTWREAWRWAGQLLVADAAIKAAA